MLTLIKISYLNTLPEDTKEHIVTAEISDKEQCVDPNKTAHDVFKMVYGVPIQDRCCLLTFFISLTIPTSKSHWNYLL